MEGERRMRKKKFLKTALSLIAVAALITGCSSGAKSGKKGNTLVIGEKSFNQKFSPFFSDTVPDKNVADMTQVSLIDSDRAGMIIKNGIKGEKRKFNGKNYTYKGISDLKEELNDDGTIDYTITLKKGLKFSDGKPLTADDVIFSMYVLSDPTYDGGATLYTLPIKGMKEYRGGMENLLNLMLKAGKDNKDFSLWKEQDQKNFWEKDLPKAGEKFAQSIIDYEVDNKIVKKGASVKEAAKNWGYDGLKDDAKAIDFWNAIISNKDFEGDIAAAADKEKATKSLLDILGPKYQKGIEKGNTVDHIEGIKKINDYKIKIHMDKVDAPAIYQLTLSVSPLHYYGDPKKYDYKKNKFGFDKGDLSKVKSKSTKPLGAGPYVFKGYKNGTVSFEANKYYFKGEPKTKYINFLESQEADLLNGVTTGTIDIAEPSITSDVIKAIKQQNGNKKLTGDKIKTTLYPTLGYGYIGINANLVKVGNDSGSEQSKALRKGFATVIAAYRDVAIDSYYGDAASVINYPISTTSWAAPQKTDTNYKVAFSVDKDGKEIYQDGMSDKEKYQKALDTALGFFEKAGCKVADGKVVAGPNGKPLEYTITIPADGKGDHPSFMILNLASKALKKIGVKLDVHDLSDGSQLWTGLQAQQIPMWCAAWQATIDPDMYQVYYSDVANGGKNKGGSTYHYNIKDEKLDKLILEARTNIDQQYRKAKYKEALNIVVDWATEIPVYQRKDCNIFAADRVDVNTLTKDTTSFYGYMKEIEKIELK